MLDERKIRILQAIVDDYILTAMPVGSRTLSRKYMKELSSATIRNEMSDLEELGYLAQPHTSAGRIPSYLAYRLYVDRMMQVGHLRKDEVQQIRNTYDARIHQMQETLSAAARAIADSTNYTSVIVPPESSGFRLRHVEMVPVSESSALLIIVTDLGVVKDAVVRIPDGMPAEQLHMLSQLITEHLQGCRLEDIATLLPDMARELHMHQELFGQVCEVVQRQLHREDGASLLVGGATNMLAHPEYADLDRARALLSTLESKDRLYQLLQRSRGLQMTISIGPEMDIPEMRDCSLVTMSYTLGGQDLGMMGVIGPVRMNYPRVVAVLDTIRTTLAQALGESTGPPPAEG